MSDIIKVNKFVDHLKNTKLNKKKYEELYKKSIALHQKNPEAYNNLGALYKSVDKFEEAGADGLMRLYCSIVVDRETHKPIVIGHRGIRIKQIGTEARQELERFFGTRVFLDLHVRVKRGWREDNRMLHELGLTK